MELSRAKTLLIAAFFLLNLFLFYHIWEEKGESLFPYGQEEELSQLESALEEAKLEMAIGLPRGGIRIGHLVVEPWKIERSEAVHPVWDALGIEREAASDVLEEQPAQAEEERVIISRHGTGDYRLVLREGGTVSLNSALETPSEEDVAWEEMEKAAQDFVDGIPYMADFELDYMQRGQEGTVLNYRQVYDHFPLYAGYLQVFMNGLDLTGFYLYRLEPVGFAEQAREIVPPSTALLRFLEVYAPDGRHKAIVDFSLGYYSQEYDAERWEIPPVWRIRLNNGELYYINAFTGNLER